MATKIHLAKNFVIDVDRYYRSPVLVCGKSNPPDSSSYYVEWSKNTTTTMTIQNSIHFNLTIAYWTQYLSNSLGRTNMYLMDRRRRDKEKLGLRSSEKLIHYQELQFTTFSIGVKAASSIPKSREEKVIIETPKVKVRRTKTVLRHANFLHLARFG